MKANEILSALDLIRGKETILFCSNLYKIFSFLNSIREDIKEAQVVETDLIISDKGQILTYDYINKDFGDKLVNKFRFENNEIKELSNIVDKCNSDLSTMYDKLRVLNRPSSKTSPEKIEDFKKEMGLIREEKNKNEKQISDLLEVERLRLYSIHHSIDEIRKEFKIFIGVRIYVTINKNNGIYSFVLPVNNKFYSEVCRLLKINVIDPLKEEKKVLKTISIDSEILHSIKKASKFVSLDHLRPNMQGICLHFENNYCEVIATDAHKMYMSEQFKCDSGNEIFEIIIAHESIKKVNSIKTGSPEIELNIFEDTISIDTEEIAIFKDAKYPRYKDVVPVYSHNIVFDRKNIIKAVKQVVVYSNRSTSQVNFYMNGQIEITAQDVDFSFEAARKVNYISKSFEDTTISFNGNFFNTCLDNFKEETIEMETDGQSTKGVIFTNKKDRVLLMPLLTNS